MKVISIEKVLKAAGGAAALRDLLEQAGQPVPTASTVISVWRFRGRVPGRWVGAVIYALAREANVNPLDLLADAEVEITAEELGL
jgi:hypothetical protein